MFDFLGDALGAIAQMKVYKQLWIGYSYDFSLTKLAHFNSGTHEIMLSYDFILVKRKMQSPKSYLLLKVLDLSQLFVVRKQEHSLLMR